MDDHPTLEALMRVARGSTADGERQAVLGHCETCERCGDHLAVLLLLGEQEAPATMPSTSRRRAVAAVGIAATLLIAVASLAIIGLRGPDGAESVAPPSEERALVTAAWAEFATDENLNPLTYQFVVRVVYGELIRMSDVDHVLAIKSALYDLETDEYSSAVDKLRALSVNPSVNATDIAGWLGIALYLSGETSDEVEALLRRGTESRINPLERGCQWYLGHHLFRVGRPEEGMLWIAVLSPNPTAIGRKAAEFFGRLPLESLDPEVVRSGGPGVLSR